MLIYNYHPDSGVFLGQGEADKSPADDEWLIPAHATDIAPPEPSAGHAAVFRDGAWGEVVDHRGEVWFGADGQPMEVRQVGDPADHGLTQEPPPLPDASPATKVRFALIHEADGLVVQTLDIALPMTWQDAEGYSMVVDHTGTVRPGFTYDGASFTPPPDAEEPAT